MKRAAIAAIILPVLFVTPFFASASDCPIQYGISRTLKIGSRGNEVRILQVTLNSLDGYHVSASGVGSVGFEGTLYGKATARAVVKFQMNHGIDATGVFGPLTRAAIRSIVCASVPITTPAATLTQTSAVTPLSTLPLIKPSAPPISTTTPVVIPSTPPAVTPPVKKPFSMDEVDPAMRKALEDSADLMSKMGTPISDIGNLEKKLILGGTSPRAASAGSEVGVYGNGFIAPATIEVAGRSLPLNITSGAQARLALPSDIKPGLYDIVVKTKNGTSNTERMAVTLPGSNPPTITHIDPASGNVGAIVTITGTNFADTNDIDTSGGTVTNVSSDGKSIRFTLSADPSLLFNGKIVTGISFGLRVRNKFGSSDFSGITIN